MLPLIFMSSKMIFNNRVQSIYFLTRLVLTFSVFIIYGQQHFCMEMMFYHTQFSSVMVSFFFFMLLDLLQRCDNAAELPPQYLESTIKPAVINFIHGQISTKC